MADMQIEIVDGIKPELQRIASSMRRPRALMAALGKELEVQLRAHFAMRDREPNARGFTKKHFWSRTVRNATALTEVSDSRAIVSIASPEFAHKVFGGTITAKRAKALAIPLTNEAYQAERASLFPRPLAFIPRPGKPPLLVEKTPGGKNKGEAWTIHYVLLKSVTQTPDPRAWPTSEKVEPALLARAQQALLRELRAS